MLDLELLDSDGERRMLRVPDECIIGRGAQNEIRLDSWRIAREHARLFSTAAGVQLEDLGGFGGVLVNGQRIAGQYGPLTSADSIAIGPYQLRLLDTAARPEPDLPMQQASGQAVPARAQIAPVPFCATPPSSPPAAEAIAATATATVTTTMNHATRQLEFEWRKLIHARLLETMDLRRQDVHGMSDQQLRQETETLVRQIMRDAEAEIPRPLDRALLMEQVINEAIALGPLEELLADESVSEIMVNRFDEIYVERAGRLHRHPLAFTGDRAVMGVIERIVAPLGPGTSWARPTWCASAPSARRWQSSSRLAWSRARTSSSPAAPAPARPRCSTSCPISYRAASGS
jgi:pilus assembly protein CpaF